MSTRQYQLASRAGDTICVMAWHYHDDDMEGSEANVAIRIAGLPTAISMARLTHYRIEKKHSNAFSLCKKMGSPQSLNVQQYAELERKGRLETIAEPHDITVNRGEATVLFELPRAAVSLVVVELIH